MGTEVDTAGGVHKGRLSFTIAQGASQSSAIEMNYWIPNAVEMPAAWDAADLTFLGSFDGVNYYPLYLDSAEVKITAPAAQTIQLLPSGFMPAVKYLKVRSGTLAAPVNQTTAARTMFLHVTG